ncbi:MAG TPA: PQQ-binding-like beta-propeller repeat protein, partial [Acidimicrobiia bacterium]
MRRSALDRTAMSAFVALLLLVTGCTVGELAAKVVPEGGSFQIKRSKGGLCSFDTRTALLRVDSAGAVAWELYTPFSWSNRLLTRHGIGVLEVENGAVAFDWETGRPLWQAAHDSNWRAILGASVVALVDPSRRQIAGLDWESGSTVWSIETDEAIAYGGATNGELVFINRDGQIVALDVASGETVWERPVRGDPSFAPRFEDGMLLNPAFEGAVYRLDPETGRIMWQWDAPDGSIAVTDAIDVSEGVVLVTTTGWYGPEGDREPQADAYQLVALNAGSGALLWSRVLTEEEVGNQTVFEPATLVHVADGVAVLHSPMVDRLEAVSIDIGETLWEYVRPGFRRTRRRHTLGRGMSDPNRTLESMMTGLEKKTGH